MELKEFIKKNNNKVLLLAILCCLQLTVQSQAYYYFSYKPIPIQNANLSYHALLTLQADGNAVARVQYNSTITDQFFIYEFELTDTILNPEESGRHYLVARSNAKPITDPDPAGFIVPRFVFAKDDTDSGYYKPVEIELPGNDESWKKTELTDNIQKSYNDLRLDENLVGSFYFDTEPFYKYIFEQTFRATPGGRSERLFLIMVGNTNDETVGASAQTDLNNISAFFKKVAEELNLAKLIPLTIAGSNFSKAGVEGALLALENQKPTSDDIVVFYYSGHGYRLPGDMSPYSRISFRNSKDRLKNKVGENMLIEDIHKRLQRLKPNVSLLLADCCNANIFTDPVVGGDLIQVRGADRSGNFNFDMAKDLFLPLKPLSIIVGSVEQDHLSVGSPDLGGYYTHFFRSELEKNLWGSYSIGLPAFNNSTGANWNKILLTASKNTYWKSKAKQCGPKPADRCIQQAIINISTR